MNLVRMIRQVRPQRVVTWSPEWNWQRFRNCHPDHLATGAALLAAIYPDAGNPFALSQLREQEGLDAWTLPEARWRAAQRSAATRRTAPPAPAALAIPGNGHPEQPAQPHPGIGSLSRIRDEPVQALRKLGGRGLGRVFPRQYRAGSAFDHADHLCP